MKQNPLSQVRCESRDEKNEEDRYILLLPPGRMAVGGGNSEEEEGKDAMDLCSLPPRSVATIDSFDSRNQDFIRFS